MPAEVNRDRSVEMRDGTRSDKEKNGRTGGGRGIQQTREGVRLNR